MEGGGNCVTFGELKIKCKSFEEEKEKVEIETDLSRNSF